MAQKVGTEGALDGQEAHVAARRFGALLHRARVEAGLSQNHVATAAGMDRRHYQELEQGFSNSRKRTPANPRLVTILGLARALGIDPADMIRAAAEGADSVYHAGDEQH